VASRASRSLLLVAVASAAGFGCMRVREPAGPPPTPAPTGLVLICLDTLRADALASMPALRGFAASATTFSDATSSSPWTAPAVATLLTGLEPRHGGVRGAFVAGALPPTVTTIAESLRDHGWSTAAFTVGGWVSAERGYAQGFDAFGTGFDAKTPETTVAEWDARRPKDRPFFLFLHSNAPHDPYGPKSSGPEDPRPDAARAAALREEARRAFEGVDLVREPLSPALGGWLAERYLLDGAARTAIGEALGDERASLLAERFVEWLDGAGRGSLEMAALAPRAAARYREGLAWADRTFSRTLAALSTCDLPRGTTIAVVGDHGELLGEHGTLSHGRWLHDPLLRVPLVIRAPGRMPVRDVAGSCGLVDVAPTLLELAGVPAPRGIDGRSLVAFAAGTAPARPVLAEEDRRRRGGEPDLVRSIAVRTAAAKYVATYDPRTGRVESEQLLDLALDPAEEQPRPFDGAAAEAFGETFAHAVARVRADLGLAAPPTKVASLR
jgi:arylsulfatase A-like enzyme